MKLGIVGLGRMGAAIAKRVLAAGNEVIGFDLDEVARKHLQDMGGQTVNDLSDLAEKCRVIWLMVPAGEIVDKVIADLKPNLQKGDIIIDGGNSNFQNTARRAQELKPEGISYIDCGTSGGLLGEKIGFSLMIGGDKDAFRKVEPIFKAVAIENGYNHLGPSGAGHYVKMVHNGVEYSLLQGYAEGFHLLKETQEYPDLDLEEISSTWQNGSVIRSWLVDLAHEVFEEDQDLNDVSGDIGGGQTGRWTYDEAKRQNVPMRLLADSLEIRKESQETGGNYATKVVAMLRNKFGGHKVTKAKK